MSKQPEAKLNLYQKILAVMEAIDYLEKDDTVAFGNTKYQAISEEKVTRAVREQLIKNKLVVLPIEQEHKKEGNLTTVDVKYKIVDTETGDSEILVSSGTGADTQDKGVGKAMTYAFKYLFLRTFAIPTGEDPDKTSSAELDAKEKQMKSSQQQNGQRKLTQAQINRLFAIAASKGIDAATVKKGIVKDYKKTNAEDLTKQEYDELCKRLENAKVDPPISDIEFQDEG